MVLGVASPTTALGWLTVGRGISCCSFCVYGNWLYSLISCGCSQLNLLWFYLLLKVTRERLVLSKIGALLPVSNVPRLLLGVLGMLSRGVVGQAGMQHSFMLIHPKVFSIFLFLPLPNDERAFYSESFCWHLVVSYFKIQCCGQRIYFCGLNSSTFLETHCVLLNTMFLAAVKWFFFLVNLDSVRLLMETTQNRNEKWVFTRIWFWSYSLEPYPTQQSLDRIARNQISVVVTDQVLWTWI